MKGLSGPWGGPQGQMVDKGRLLTLREAWPAMVAGLARYGERWDRQLAEDRRQWAAARQARKRGERP